MPSFLSMSISLIKGSPMSVLGSSPEMLVNRQMPSPSILKLPAQS